MRHVLHRFITQVRGDVLAAESPQQTCELARAAIDQGYQRLIVAGGDGTVSRVINGIAPRFGDIELAILPLGTGNDMARSLGMPIDDTQAALELAFEGSVAAVDLGRVRGATDVYFVNAASGGAGGRVAKDVHSEDKARWGPMAYWVTAFSQLVKLQQYDVTLEVDDQRHQLQVYGVVVANGRFVGGGFPIAPRAAINDGLLDVTTIPVLPTLELLSAGLNYAMGRHEQVEQIGTFRGRRVHIVADPPIHFSIDGEPIQAIDTTFEILPHALRMVVGPQPALQSP